MSELEDRINSVLGDPAQMERITKLAQSLMGGRDGTGAEGAAPAQDQQSGPGGTTALGGLESLVPGLDMEALGRVGRLLNSSAASDSKEQALLSAMKPFLSEKRRGKMDRAMKLAKLAKLAGFAMNEMESDNDA